MLGILGRIKFSSVFILVALCGQLVQAISTKHSDYVIFDTVSVERIEQRKQAIATLLDEQANTRKRTVVGACVTTLLALAGGGAYWYYAANQKAVQPKKQSRGKVRNLSDELLEQHIAYVEERRTFFGGIKCGVRDNIGFAIASASTAILMALVNKFGSVSWSAVKSAVYPTTADFCAEQEQFLKQYFDYLFEALRDLGREQARIETPEQLATFMQWRGMLAADVQTSVAVMVRSVEDFSAFAIEFMNRTSNALPEEKQNLAQPFDNMMHKIQTLITAINQLSTTLEAVVNIAFLEDLEQMKMRVSMHFKHAVFAARDASSQLATLVNGI